MALVSPRLYHVEIDFLMPTDMSDSDIASFYDQILDRRLLDLSKEHFLDVKREYIFATFPGPFVAKQYADYCKGIIEHFGGEIF